ncbi:MAG: hypothetical protein ACKV2T_21565 [Kofleriaceae bacterium]
MRRVLVLLLIAACGDDGVRRLADAPTVDDAAADAAADALPDAGPTTRSEWDASSGVPPNTISCVPWTLVDTSDEDPVLASGELTLGNNSDGETLYFAHTTVLTMPAMLVIEGRVRYGGGTSQANSRTSTMINFSLANDMKNSLFIGDGEIFMLTAESTRDTPHTAATNDVVHSYRIEVNTTTYAVAVFRDGVSVLVGTLFLSPYDVPDAITWGEGSIVANGSSHWTHVSHNALTAVVCP